MQTTMQTTKSILLSWLWATFTVCAAAGPTTARADTLAASAASARLGNERPCIRYDYGRAVNTCLSDVLVNVTARVQKTGTRDMLAAGDNGTRCRAFRLNQDGVRVQETAERTLRVPTVGIFTYVGTFGVTAGDTIIFECVLKANQVSWLGAVAY
jgi:hypothetical protein